MHYERVHYGIMNIISHWPASVISTQRVLAVNCLTVKTYRVSIINTTWKCIHFDRSVCSVDRIIRTLKLNQTCLCKA